MDRCLMVAPFVALFTSLFKLSPTLQRNPKTVALILAAGAVGVRHYLVWGIPATRAEWDLFGQCLVGAWGLTVASFEAVLKPAGKSLNIDVAKLAIKNQEQR